MLTLNLLNFSIKVLNKINKLISNKNPNLLPYLQEVKEKIIFSKVNKYFPLRNYSNELDSNNNKEEKIIWIFWYQGLDTAPNIVRACIDSIRANSSGYEVRLLTKDNVWDYFHAPEHIKCKFGKGKITATHFSDILRFYLLFTYGGAWIDATIFLTKTVSAIFGDRKFATLKQIESSKNKVSISNGKWTGYFLKAQKGSDFLYSLYLFFYNYWLENDVLIDYFLIDYAMKYVYLNDELFRQLVDNNSLNGDGRFFLIDNLKNDISNDLIEIIDSDSIGVHKLSYKVEGVECLKSTSLYHYILYKHLN